MKQPTPVDLHFDVEHESYSSEYEDRQKDGRGPWEDGETSFTVLPQSGSLNIRSIRVIGKRQEGENVDFLREERSELSLEENASGNNFRFDLPEGYYEEMEVEFRLGSPDRSALVCIGEYSTERMDGTTEATPFRLDIKEEMTLNLEVETKGGAGSFELIEGKPRHLQVRMHTREWYTGASSSLWEELDTVEPDDGAEYIPIESGKNGNIHTVILGRFKTAFKARIL